MDPRTSRAQTTDHPDMTTAKDSREISLELLRDFTTFTKTHPVPSPRIFSKQIEAVRIFQRMLLRELSLDELNAKSELFSAFNPHFNRDHFRFFAIPSITTSGLLCVTVFLEATASELAARPVNYRNANQWLHNPFFSATGMMRKHPELFIPHQRFANVTEHTAYSQFYVFREDKNNLGILIHPAQRSRLAFNPKSDPSYKNFKQKVFNFIGELKQSAVRLKRSASNEAQSLGLHLEMIAQYVEPIYKNAFKESMSASVQAAQGYLHEVVHQISALWNRVSQDDRKHLSRPWAELLRDTNRYIRRAEQVASLERKFHEGAIQHYRSPDEITGSQRELIFLGISDIFAWCLAEASDRPVRRYMLSTKQLSTMRLWNEHGLVRERIKIIPRLLESCCSKVSRTFHLHQVSDVGKVSDDLVPERISLVALDVIGGNSCPFTRGVQLPLVQLLGAPNKEKIYHQALQRKNVLKTAQDGVVLPWTVDAPGIQGFLRVEHELKNGTFKLQVDGTRLIWRRTGG
jgi:hypothetical protein